ncbi:MAG: ribokinase [Muribaculaceae bacterium]|nr:ribokinase [Muribaculaceae bacterium]
MESKNINKKGICCIGHITHDKIVTPRTTAHLPGGTAYYFGHAMAGLGCRDFKLVTSLAPSDMNAVEELRAAGVEVSVVPGGKTVYFENIYGEDSNNRIQRVRAKAVPFSPESLNDVEGDIYHLGTLLADDFPLEVIESLSTRGKVSADAQGYLREVRGEEVVAIDWHDKEKALPYIDILKANEHEMEVLTGSGDASEAARRLSEMGVKEVVLTLGSEGSLILKDGVEHYIPAYTPKEVVDATGCGDTYMAGYLYMREKGHGVDESGRFAAAMCTLKLEASGPFRGNEEDVRRVMNGF